jgi:hypothetical protein
MVPCGPNKRPCEKTLRNAEPRIAKYKLTDAVYGPITRKYTDDHCGDSDTAVGDCTLAPANIKRLDRRRLLYKVARDFLLALKKSGLNLFRVLSNESPDLLGRYRLEKGGKGKTQLFPRCSWAKTRPGIDEVVDDISCLLHIKEDRPLCRELKPGKLLARAFGDQCEVDRGRRKQVKLRKFPPAWLKPRSEVPATALQSPVDEDATYNGRKDIQRFKVGVVEIRPKPPGEGGVRGAAIVQGVEVMGANESDSKFFPLFMKLVTLYCARIAKLLLDAAFTSQADYEIAQSVDVEVYSPVNGNTPSDEPADGGRNRITLDMFDTDYEGRITACPLGNVAGTTFVETEKGRKYSAEFCLEGCAACPRNGDCRARH